MGKRADNKSPRQRKEPRQKTHKGLEIPVPARGRFFDELDRTIKKTPAKSSGRGTTSH
jgi:hypothetical protein